VAEPAIARISRCQFVPDHDRQVLLHGSPDLRVGGFRAGCVPLVCRHHASRLEPIGVVGGLDLLTCLPVIPSPFPIPLSLPAARSPGRLCYSDGSSLNLASLQGLPVPSWTDFPYPAPGPVVDRCMRLEPCTPESTGPVAVFVCLHRGLPLSVRVLLLGSLPSSVCFLFLCRWLQFCPCALLLPAEFCPAVVNLSLSGVLPNHCGCRDEGCRYLPATAPDLSASLAPRASPPGQ
jgi:hypothetical protein